MEEEEKKKRRENTQSKSFLSTRLRSVAGYYLARPSVAVCFYVRMRVYVWMCGWTGTSARGLHSTRTEPVLVHYVWIGQRWRVIGGFWVVTLPVSCGLPSFRLRAAGFCVLLHGFCCTCTQNQSTIVHTRGPTPGKQLNHPFGTSLGQEWPRVTTLRL